MDKETKITEYFANVETTKEHNGYFCSVGEALTIVILGSVCGLRNVSQIQQWAANERIRQFLARHFNIEVIPCYYWLTCLLKLIKPTSLNQCFMSWAQSLVSDKTGDKTISFDGKTICSTNKMADYERPLHIVSAHLAEMGLTLGQRTVDEKSNEIPAVRELLKLLDVEGCMIVADALHCQKETAETIVKQKADYLLSVKDNQEGLKRDIEDYVQDDDMRRTMDTHTTIEKNRGRIERRTAYATSNTDWLASKAEWAGLLCIGAVNTRFTDKKGTTNEWHYYISSRNLTAAQLQRHARLEWSIESMHWLLDVHFDEDYCRVEDGNIQQNLNMVRKIALNSIKVYKAKTMSKQPLSQIMLNCLLDSDFLLHLLTFPQN
jgi:predicted transposase YbfD/YdcC